ncbi:unnamed protein product [Protopolystoma xenopodis]|uniref:Uncharacterized protein n=1 Tax=Protopolystoma xenopodis TaxID=117903 RepID=A0A448XSJ2_9PLAT|nr:unnamed protein product [Protopolystoma xenopodis]
MLLRWPSTCQDQADTAIAVGQKTVFAPTTSCQCLLPESWARPFRYAVKAHYISRGGPNHKADSSIHPKSSDRCQARVTKDWAVQS